MLEMKSAISKVLRNFELQVAPDYQLILVFEIILRPHNGMMLLINKRQYWYRPQILQIVITSSIFGKIFFNYEFEYPWREHFISIFPFHSQPPPSPPILTFTFNKIIREFSISAFFIGHCLDSLFICSHLLLVHALHFLHKSKLYSSNFLFQRGWFCPCCSTFPIELSLFHWNVCSLLWDFTLYFHCF